MVLLSTGLFFGAIMSYVHATDVGGLIDTNTTWNLAGSPYIVRSNIGVTEGVKLTIDQGVVIKFTPNTGLVIGGELRAIGTEDNMIFFTSLNDNPSPGDWDGIHFTPTCIDAEFDHKDNYINGTIIRYSIIEFAGGRSDYTGAIYCDYSSPFIDGSVLRNNGTSTLGGAFHCVRSSPVVKLCDIENNLSDFGSAFYLSFASPLIEYNNIINNGNKSIYCFRSTPILKRNNLIDNLPYTIYIKDGSFVEAQSNWWGTSNTPTIDEMIYDYYDDISLGEVIYLPIASQLYDFNNLPLNEPPIANAGYDQIVFDEITLNASFSSDADGTITSWDWLLTHRTNPEFNRTATGSNPTLTNLSPGFYDVTLMITDNVGAIDTNSMLLGVAGQWDIDGDNKLGLSECIYILQTLSGLKSDN